MTTVVVTGGAGFIGSNFIRMLTEKHPGYKIVCIDSLTYAGNIETILPLIDEGAIQFSCCDIRDAEGIDELFGNVKPDCVVNFAAETHVDRSIKDPKIFLETNIVGTSVLMDACIKHGVKRFHQVSTDEVYGDLPLDRPELKFTESTPLRPSSPYSSSKASADLLVMAYARTYGLPATISRCSNNYGPYQFPEKLIPLMLSKIRTNEKLPIYGKGLNVRDWIHVNDHCDAIDLVLRKGKVGEVYNIGGNNEISNIDLIGILLKETGGKEELIGFVEDRKGHDLRYAIDSTKIQMELGWAPKIGFDAGIRETVQWYSEHTGWTDNIVNGNYQKLNSKYRDNSIRQE